MLLQQPVPFAYYHVLKIQMVIVLLMIGYSLVSFFSGEIVLTLITYSIMLFIMIGTQEIAVAMSDPFGDDDLDFDTTTLVEYAYNNAISFLSEGYVESNDSKLINPLQYVLDGKRAPRFGDEDVDIHGRKLSSEFAEPSVALLGGVLKSDNFMDDMEC